MIPRRAEEFIGHDLFPDLVTMLIGTAGIAIISAVTLPWHTAVASTRLGALMVTGADVDARTYLLPDIVTLGTIALGLVAGAVLDALDRGLGAERAAGRPVATALRVARLRWWSGAFR